MFFTAVFRKPVMILLMIIGGINLVFYGIIKSKVIGEVSHNEEFHLYIGLGLVVFFPLWLFWRAGKMYTKNPALQERINMKIDAEKISIEGQTFGGDFEWEHVVKVKQTKRWVIMNRGGNIVQFIPLSSFKSEHDLRTFWRFAGENGLGE